MRDIEDKENHDLTMLLFEELDRYDLKRADWETLADMPDIEYVLPISFTRKQMEEAQV